jgi:hypothetical protein
VPQDLDSRRHAIARALRNATSSRASEAELTSLRSSVAALERRVEELAHEVAALRTSRASAPPIEFAHFDDEPVSRVAVPPVIPAKISNQAFDVLLGVVAPRETSESRTG